MSRSPTITDETWSNDRAQWLHNPHAGEMLSKEFMAPLSLQPGDLASALHMPVADLEAVLGGAAPVDGSLDLRLSRYFGMSEGFFLRLQNSYQIVEAKRALDGALDRIVPRAA